ncbi:unnamed protein product [Nezara viridula]|uniref:Neuropeptide n=1 Tax=Nezara viridula TaxID=85310 RepID=A0A451ENL7_NEZVI|nr:neuropeptide precursor [Nezara viridula]CAH1405739.1 unnamed protein product [Nezara viridula]
MCPQVFVLLLVAAVTLAAEQVLSFPCRGEECDLIPEGCLYGTVRDACGRLVCAAGPGERCGGRENHLGKCGEGMTCKCGKCRGCSIARLMSGIIECEYTNPICS